MSAIPLQICGLVLKLTLVFRFTNDHFIIGMLLSLRYYFGLPLFKDYSSFPKMMIIPFSSSFPICPLSLVQSVSHVWLFATPWTAARQASLSITNSQSLLKRISIESVMSSNHLILCRPLFLPPSIFPSIWVFSKESVLRIRWPKYWSFSFSISPSNEYSGLDFLLDWLVWFPCSPRASQESSPIPQLKSINSLVLSFLYSSTLTSVHDYWWNNSFD